jgi:hypothetical protein
MRPLLVIIVTFAVLAVSSLADDIKLTSGEILKDATITGRDAIGVSIKHSAGIARISYDLLPPELRKTFSYDAQKAKEQADLENNAALQRAQLEEAYRTQRAKEAAQADKSDQLEKAATTVSGKVLSVTARGVLLITDLPDIRGRATIDVEVDPTVREGELIFVYGVTGLVDGDYYSGSVYPAPSYSYNSRGNVARTVHAFAISKQLAKDLLKQGK